jgi:hypothetical protein
VAIKKAFLAFLVASTAIALAVVGSHRPAGRAGGGKKSTASAALSSRAPSSARTARVSSAEARPLSAKSSIAAKSSFAAKTESAVAGESEMEASNEGEGCEAPKPRSGFVEKISATSRGDHEAEGSLDGFADWFYNQRAYPAGSIPPNAMARALDSAKQLNGGLRGAPGDPTAPGGGPANPTWVSIGPSKLPNGQTDTSAGNALSPVSGRVSAIAVHPTNPNIVYASGAFGGVWKTTNALSSNPNWTPMSDHQPSLAIGDIAIDPVNPNIIYAGTGENNATACDSYYGRGLLRSLDAGTTWTVLGAQPGGPFDLQGITKVLIDPGTAGSASTTTLWVSTTLGLFNSGTEACNLAPGVWNGAVWRSTDSGQTWTLQNVPTGAALPNARIHDMALDPTNSNVLYVAVRSAPTVANGGIWKSTNAKAATPTFTKLTGGFPDASTANPVYRRITVATGSGAANQTLFASMEANNAIDAVWGLYKSTDAGATWAHVDNGQNGVASITSGSRVVTRVSGTPFTASMIGTRIIVNNIFSRTVASVTDSSHLSVATFDPAFNVTDGAATFSIGSYPPFCDGQCFYDMTISVDPTDAAGSTVYVGGNPNAFIADLAPCPFGAGNCGHSVWRSDNGGNTWRSISQGDGVAGGVHGDDHKILLDPSTTPARVYDGNDGGIWRSENKGGAWVAMNTNIAITQFQGVGLHPTNPNVVIGGTQDNGTNIINSPNPPAPAWLHTDFGDGGLSVIDQINPARMFHTYFNQSNNFMGPAKSTTGGTNGPFGWDFVGGYAGYGGVFQNGINTADPVQFYMPIALNNAVGPNNPIYIGSSRIYRSPDPLQPCCDTVSINLCGFPAPVCRPGNPPSWTAVSPALGKTAGAAVSAIGVVPNLIAGKEAIYAGVNDGRIQVSTNVDGSGVATWTVLDKAPLPNRFVTWIEVSAGDATGNTAYAAFSGFNANTPGTPGHVFKTTTGLGAATWTDISGDLPDIPANAIAIDPTRSPEIVYVGTDIGVFQSLDGGVHWAYLSEGHPVVSVFGLSRNAKTGQIVSATHGRGMFQLISNGLPDTTSPTCGGTLNGNQFNGTALDAGANDTGIASITLLPGSSNLVISSVSYSGPGSATYTVTKIDPFLPGTGTVRVTDFAGNHCDQAVSIPATASGTGANFFTVTPCRAVDTRLGNGQPVPAGGDQTFFLAGNCGIPVDATSVSVNVTVTQPTASGDLRVFAGSTTPPTTSVINFRAGQTRANNAIIRLGPGGSITVHDDQATGAVHFILDVNGYFQ